MARPSGPDGYGLPWLLPLQRPTAMTCRKGHHGWTPFISIEEFAADLAERLEEDVSITDAANCLEWMHQTGELAWCQRDDGSRRYRLRRR